LLKSGKIAKKYHNIDPPGAPKNDIFNTDLKSGIPLGTLKPAPAMTTILDELGSIL
jgi:hypothetical protein